MTEPTTANVGFIVPNTGDLVGSWGTAALNVNWQAADGYMGGVGTISLSSATTIALTTPTASFTPGAGPNQSQNAALVLSGALTGNNVLQVTMPGIYRLLNNCTGTNYVQLAPATGTGNAIGLPPGEFRRYLFDGTNVYYLDMPHVGAYLELAVATTPAWMTACTVAPYLFCDGSTHTSSIYPALSAMLGSTYGGNGLTTFGVPDLQNRYLIPIDLGGNDRITTSGCGIDGSTLGGAGGDQNMQAHTHTATSTVTDPGHSHNLLGALTQDNAGGRPLAGTKIPGNFSSGQAYTDSGGSGQLLVQNATTGLTIGTVNATAGIGAAHNVPPGIVGGMKFIKT